MTRRTPRSTLYDTLFPTTTLFRSRLLQQFAGAFSLVAGPGSGDGRAQRGGLRRQIGGQDGSHGAPRQVRPAILGLARAREQPCARGSRSALLAGKRRSQLPFARYPRSEEHTSELQFLLRISYAVSCL